jgi:hypothetical protein
MRAILGAWLIVAVAACSGYNATGPTTSGSGNSGAYGNGGGGGTGGNTGGGAPIKRRRRRDRGQQFHEERATAPSTRQ